MEVPIARYHKRCNHIKLNHVVSRIALKTGKQIKQLSHHQNGNELGHRCQRLRMAEKPRSFTSTKDYVVDGKRAENRSQAERSSMREKSVRQRMAATMKIGIFCDRRGNNAVLMRSCLRSNGCIDTNLKSDRSFRKKCLLIRFHEESLH
ncbi:unnamed protein product [Nesidiocoris tenuis]|uniref:Uncharacterized protein n=1 Tax=Nesidiocoris tenuis TaxID=355587 RepID=A0A6H5FY27_9HEMI|nr:unnamed protein product [Nesidiocoris tenuis]